MGIVQTFIQITTVIVSAYILAFLTAMYTFYETYNKEKVLRYIHTAYTVACAAYLLYTKNYYLAPITLLIIYYPITPIIQAVVLTSPNGLITLPLAFTSTTLWHIQKYETRRKNQ